MLIFLPDSMSAFGAVFKIRKTWIWWVRGNYTLMIDEER